MPRNLHNIAKQNTPSTQSINRKESVAVPDTVTGTHRLSESQPLPKVCFVGQTPPQRTQKLSQFTSKPSALLGAVPNPVENLVSSSFLPFYMILIYLRPFAQSLSRESSAKSHDKSITQVVQTTRKPAAHPLRSPSAQISRSRLPTSPSNEEQPSQQTVMNIGIIRSLFF